ncbi:hypothetical protein FRC03_011062 [Tulasnella sp. 419]|nr:hypothetical protein FRC03_011062 [Tulasnella sp. 419]
MTLLITVDDHEHLIPGMSLDSSVLLSAKATTETFVIYLESTRDKIKERARELVDGAEIEYSEETEHAQLLQNAREILEHGFKPSHVMTDKNMAQMNAIKKVFPDVPVRLCQFHVSQAINRWATDKPRGKDDDRPRLGTTKKTRLLEIFRELQRCRSMEEWPAFRLRFFKELEKIIMETDEEDDTKSDEEINREGGDEDTEDNIDDDDNDNEEEEEFDDDGEDLSTDAKKKEQLERLKKYFDENWFNETWLQYFTDINLPKDQTRDGTWNTNNWVESAFRVFDAVFLGHRKNKRIDRLAMIILYEYFPFYRYWRSSGAKQVPQYLITASLRGHALWERGLIDVIGEQRYRVWSTSELDDMDQETRGEGNRTGHAERSSYIIDFKIGARCGCTAHQQTGKSCAHIQAARLQVRAGSPEKWVAIESQTSTRARPCPGFVQKEGRLQNDHDIDKEHRKVLSLLDKRLATAKLMPKEQPAAPKATNNTQDVSPQGRPALTTPIRSQRKSPIHFSRSRGRKSSPQPKKSVSRKSSALTSTPKESKKSSTQPRKSLPKGSSAQKSSPENRHQLSSPTTQVAQRHQQGATKPPSFPLRDPIGTTHEGYREEELMFLANDYSHWMASDYTLTVDDVRGLVEMLDSMSNHLKLVVLFIVDATSYAEQLKQLDWLTIPHTDQEMRVLTKQAYLNSPIMKIYRKHLEEPVEKIVFFTLHQFHWTIQVHDLSAPRSNSVYAVNSLHTDVKVDISSQLLIQEFFRGDRKPSPPLSSQPIEYTTIPIGSQSDSTSCGFWAVFFGLSILFEIPLQRDTFMEAGTTSQAVKSKLATLYSNYRGNERGLTRRIVEQQLDGFQWN